MDDLLNLDGLPKSELVKIARQYSLYYVTKSGKGSMSNYESLSRDMLISLLKNDRDYQRAVSKLSRIEILKERLKSTSNRPESIMEVIIEVFKDTNTYPIPGKYYTFRYYAKTPLLIYDQHPLIACLGTFDWGFRGANFHLNRERNYTWPEVASGIYLIENDEISYMKTINYKRLAKVL